MFNSKDCRLNEDESKCKSYVGRCDFENLVNCDFWQFEQSDDRLSFVSESGQNGLAYLPSIDHTAHSPSNYYLTFHTNLIVNYVGQKSMGTYVADYVSNIITSNVTSDCK